MANNGLPGNVQKFNGSTGAFISTFVTSVNAANGIAFGPDGNLYVANFGPIPLVEKFNGSTGAFILNAASNTGGANDLKNPISVTFGADGDLYVTSLLTNEVLKYDPATGNFLGVFVPSTAGLNGPVGLVFGPDEVGPGDNPFSLFFFFAGD